MQKLSQILSNTKRWAKIYGTDIEKNSRDVILFNWKIFEYMDKNGQAYKAIKANARTRKKGGVSSLKSIEIVLIKNNTLDPKVWVSCSCPFFKFYCESPLFKVGSSNIHYSNGRPPHDKNPFQIPIICKHIMAAIRSGAINKKSNFKH